MSVTFGFGDLVKMTTATIGDGDTIVLGAAVPSFLSFTEAGVDDGDIISYAIEDGDDREVGRGIYNAGTLTREIFKSTNDDDPIILSGGAQVSIVASVEDLRGDVPVDGGGFSTGDVKLTTKNVADYGWVMMDDGTIGNALSGANTADEMCRDLFVLFFRNMADADVPLLTSTGGATTRAGFLSADAAWTARCRMSLPRTRSRTVAVAGVGAGLTARRLGGWQGSETRTLVGADMAAHSHGIHGWSAMLSRDYNGAWGTNAVGWSSSGGDAARPGGGGEAWSLMNPTTYFNVMVKL